MNLDNLLNTTTDEPLEVLKHNTVVWYADEHIAVIEEQQPFFHPVRNRPELCTFVHYDFKEDNIDNVKRIRKLMKRYLKTKKEEGLDAVYGYGMNKKVTRLFKGLFCIGSFKDPNSEDVYDVYQYEL